VPGYAETAVDRLPDVAEFRGRRTCRAKITDRESLSAIAVTLSRMALTAVGCLGYGGSRFKRSAYR
jgi:hypothetical protein